MPQLNPEAGIPTIQLVGPEMTREELLDIYLEVYKLHKLPGSPPGEPAVLEEIMASVPGHLWSKGGMTCEATMQPLSRGSHSSRSRAPHWERRDNLIGKRLTTVCRAHQKALVAVATLEEEINWLSCTRAHLKSRARSKSRDCWRPSGEGQKKRCCQVRFADEASPSQSANPETLLGEKGSEGRGSDLEELPELKPMVASFLQGLPETSDDEAEKTLLEPAISDFGQWVPWRAERCEMPEWWVELSTMPGKEDTRRLAREVRASFDLPWQLQELDSREATLQAPPALPCMHRKRFMLPADSIFACRDIWEVPREKVVVYARALQYWAEQNNPPAGGEPCLLAKSVQELREEVKWYLSFTDKEVFQGVALLERKKRRRIQGSLLLPLHPRCPRC